jgi:hypothetical protein
VNPDERTDPMAAQLPTTAPSRGSTDFGKLHKTDNNDYKDFAAWIYNRVLIKNEEGEFETLLFTDNELKVARARSEKNPEEMLTPSLVDKLRAL